MIKTLDEITKAFNSSTNMSDEFIISQFMIAELQRLQDLDQKKPLEGFALSIKLRASELYRRHFGYSETEIVEIIKQTSK